jgi:hypothetical protein
VYPVAGRTSGAAECGVVGRGYGAMIISYDKKNLHSTHFKLLSQIKENSITVIYFHSNFGYVQPL